MAVPERALNGDSSPSPPARHDSVECARVDGPPPGSEFGHRVAGVAGAPAASPGHFRHFPAATAESAQRLRCGCRAANSSCKRLTPRGPRSLRRTGRGQRGRHRIASVLQPHPPTHHRLFYRRAASPRLMTRPQRQPILAPPPRPAELPSRGGRVTAVH